MEEIYHQLAELARRHGAQRLVLFGSRARGDNKERSDIDLAVYGMPQKERAGHRAYTPRHGPKILEKHRKGWCDAVCCRRLKTIRTL